MFCEELRCTNIISTFIIRQIFQKSFFLKKIQQKSPSAKCQRAGKSWLPGQDDYRTFCMSDETEKVHRKLEEIIGVC